MLFCGIRTVCTVVIVSQQLVKINQHLRFNRNNHSIFVYQEITQQKKISIANQVWCISKAFDPYQQKHKNIQKYPSELQYLSCVNKHRMGPVRLLFRFLFFKAKHLNLISICLIAVYLHFVRWTTSFNLLFTFTRSFAILSRGYRQRICVRTWWTSVPTSVLISKR